MRMGGLAVRWVRSNGWPRDAPVSPMGQTVTRACNVLTPDRRGTRGSPHLLGRASDG